MAELLGMSLGALLFIACFREAIFKRDLTRNSWVKGGLAAIPFIFVVRLIGDAQGGVLEASGATLQAGIAGILTAAFFIWAKLKADLPYERTDRKFPQILAWVVILLVVSLMGFKLSTGLA